MKILITSIWPINKFSIGGTERYIIDLSTALKKSGHNVHVLMLSGENNFINEVEYLPIEITGISKLDEYSIKESFFKEFNQKNLDAFSNLIQEHIDSNNYDIVHINSLLQVGVKTNALKVVTVHTNPFEFDQNWGKGSFQEIAKVIADKYSHNILFCAPSMYYAKQYKEAFKTVVKYIPHAINPQRLITSLSKAECLKKYGIKDGFNILVPSRLELEQKRQDLGLKSIIRAKTKLPKNTQVIFTGLDDQYGANIDFLNDLAKQANIPCYFIKFTDMSEAYNITDIVLLPSRSESFGYAALESLTKNLKTILSDIPSFKEIAIGNNYAFISKQTVIGFAEKLIEAVRCKTQSENSQKFQHWQNRYSLGQWVKRYLNFYTNISES